MNIYFDTEFTGLHKNTALISIGMIAENGRTFYAELNDYDRNQVNDWIQDNVIANLLHNGERFMELSNYCAPYSCVMGGSKEYVKAELKRWLSQFDSVQLVSDVCYYDMILFIDLFGSAFKLPSNVNASCHDINQDIAKYYNISEKEAFDISREEMVLSLNKKITGEKHNSLYDAKIIKEIYEGINTSFERNNDIPSWYTQFQQEPINRTCYPCYENK